MKHKTKKNEISHEDIQRALNNFKKSGGLIQRLPDQYTPARVMAEGMGVFENLEEFLAKVDHAA